MVYVYAKKSKINEYIGKELSVDEIKDTLIDMGMDLKGESDDKDPELKIEITAEKIDMVSVVGIARAIKYYRRITKGYPIYNLSKSDKKVIVKKTSSESRPRTVCAILKDVDMNQDLLNEIIEVQEKIHASFGRNRKKVSIGIYPLNKISFPITYGSEDPKNIKFKPLDSDKEMTGIEILEFHDKGKMFKHLLEGFEKFPVFRDSKGNILSMPPIINSEDTGKVETNHKDLFIECSGFNLNYLDSVLKVLVTSFYDLGCKIESIEVEYEAEDNYELNLGDDIFDIETDKIRKVIGTELSQKEIELNLNKMMYGVDKVEDNKIYVKVPPFKADVWNDIDIIDDIARGYGYNNIELTSPKVDSVGKRLDSSLFRDRLSDSLVSLGFNELYTYMLTSTEFQLNKFDNKIKEGEYEKLLDSEDEGYNMLRVNIMPEILRSLNVNRKNKYPHKVFENGFCIKPDKNIDTKAKNNPKLAVAIADPKSNYTWIKGVFDSFIKLNDLNLKVKPNDNCEFLIPGRSADIILDNQKIGYIGEISPSVLENFGLIVPVVGFELEIEKLIK